MNLVEKDFISFVDGKCRFGDSGQYFRYGALEASVRNIPSGGYYVSVNDDFIEVTLASARKSVRRFGSMDSAAKFLASTGFKSFHVNLI